MGWEPRYYIPNNLLELADDLPAWDAYPLGKFEKEDYGSLFAKWSNPILSMAPTSIELLQSRFIRSVKYFCTSLVNGQHNLSLTASPQVLPQVDAAAVEPEPPLVGHVFVHEPQLQLETGLVFEHEPPVEHDSAHTINDFDVAIEEQSESVPMFIREELVAEHHAIITSVQFIETVIVGDPSFVVKELIAVKKMIIAIEKIIKSKNDDMSEDSVAKQFVQKEVGSCDEKAQSAILDVFIGEVSCDKFVRNIYDGESSKNNDMCEDYVANESVHKEVKAGDGKVFSTWMAFGGNTLAGAGVAGIKRSRRYLSSDDIRNMAMASGRGRLKEDIELTFFFPADFVVIDYVADPRAPLILGRPFLRMTHALIDVHGEQMTLRHDDQSVTFKVGDTKTLSYNIIASVNQVDVIDIACEEYIQEVLEISKSGNPTSPSELMIDSRSPSFTPFGGSDFLMEEIDAFLEHDDSIPAGVDGIYDSEGDIVYLEELLSVINSDPNLSPSPVCEINVPDKIKSSCEDPPDLELKDLPSHLELLKRLPEMRTVAFLMDSQAIIQSNDPHYQGKKTTFTCPYVTYALSSHARMGYAMHRALLRVFSVDAVSTDDIYQDFSKSPAYDPLLEKETQFNFSKECIEAIETLNVKLTQALILVAPDWDLPFEIMCDPSDFAVGAVLGQRKTKHFQPIHYASKTMTEAQAHYTTTEKELLAVVKAYIILNKHTKKVEESLNVTFDETPPPSKTSPLVDDDLDEEEAIKVTKKKNLENDIVDETLEIDEIVNIKESRNHPLENVIGNLNQRTLRSQAQNQSNFFCFISTIEPKNVNEALGDESWIVAMQEELNQFIANDIWELVPQPRNMTIIGTKWVFRNKLDENGIVSQNKARLVAQGYNQQEGIDYDETYAPVARLESIRILLAYACALDFKLFQMDVKSAFLNGFINEEVYVAQPPGFIDFEKPDHVYKLKKALYGLKQAPKAWMLFDILVLEETNRSCYIHYRSRIRKRRKERMSTSTIWDEQALID
ncbi:retrovirus-related pol polyprotein from transposon TNT 1-94 [Tanacetum coccineum]